MNSKQIEIFDTTLPDGEKKISKLIHYTNETGEFYLTIDLATRQISAKNNFMTKFEIEGFRRFCLLNGLDEIEITWRHEEKISEYEKQKLY